MKLLFLLIIPSICFSQNSYTKLTKLTKSEFEKAVNDSIAKLDTPELNTFLTTLKNSYKTDIKPFSNKLINKFENTSGQLEMHSLLQLLLDLKTDTAAVENILNNRKEVWDNGQWAEKFWKTIRQNKLKVKEGSYYTVDATGQKRYNLRLFLEDKVANNEIGATPLLFINSTLTDFPINQLYETLQKLDIKDISIIPIDKSIDLFGSKGTDGMLKVLTR
ncbi:MAG: hypothetical protein QM710_13125 [Flavobacterium sp.]